MALVPVTTFLPSITYGTSIPALSNMTIDAGAEKAAVVFYPPKLGDIHKIVFATRTVTTGDTVDVRVETVDPATGDPTGTLFGTTTNASQVIADANDNTAFTVTLTADATVADLTVPMAVVIVNGGAGGSMNIAAHSTGVASLPYADLYTGTWAKNNGVAMSVGLEYSDGSYAMAPGLYPIMLINASSGFGTGSTPDERGMVFTCPVDCQVGGAWAHFDMDGDVQFVLYDTDGATPLATATLDKDVRAGLSAAVTMAQFTPTTLAAGSTYRLVVKPTTATTVVLYDFDTSSAAAMDSFSGGQAFHYTSAKDPSGTGSWTDVTTKRPMMGLFITKLDDGAGGGGGGTGGQRIIGG